MFIDLMMMCFGGIMGVIVIGIVGALIISGFKQSSDVMEVLSKLFIRITLPCLVFSNMATKFRIGGIQLWWAFPLIGILLFIAGALLAYGYLTLDRSVSFPGVFTASVTFHNSILLPLAFAPVLFSGDNLTTFLNLLFLYNILTIPAFFTVGVWMVHTSSDKKYGIRDMVTPPTIATILGLLFAVTGWHTYLPEWLMSQLRIFGSLSTSLSILIVGGVIVASFSKITVSDWKDPLKIAFLKSIVLPVLATVYVILARPPEYIALFVVMGSVMPVSSVLAVVIPSDNAIQKTVAGCILITYLASIVVVPVFLSIHGMLYGWM